MIIFKKDDTNYIKYLVTFDEEAVRALRTKIIDDCSWIFTEKVQGFDFPSIQNPLKIRNVHRDKCLGIRTTDDGINQEYYEFSYLRYDFPWLVNLIDRLLDGDSSAIGEIDTYSDKGERVDYDAQIESLSSKIDAMDNKTQTSEKIEGLEALEHLKLLASLNRNQLRDEAYLPMLKDLIVMTPIGVIPIDVADSVLSFVDSNYQSTILNEAGKGTIYDINVMAKSLEDSFSEMSEGKHIQEKEKPFTITPRKRESFYYYPKKRKPQK